MNYIADACHVKNGQVHLNGTLLWDSKISDVSKFLKSGFRNFELNYPKFHKMDRLSKLAFLSANVILGQTVPSVEKKPDIALLFSNRAASLDTDRKHQQSIDDKVHYFPSPSVFVYTLPNICLGEISIRFKLHSENSFFIFDHFNAPHLHLQTEQLLISNKANRVLCGWVDVDGHNYEAFLYLVTKNQTPMEHSVKTIESLYRNL